MKPSTLIIFAFLLSACGVVRPVLDQDNTKVEVKVVEKIVKDTAWLELPVIIEKRATLDTASTLENKYAKSEASVSGGVLHHSLQTKPVREPVEVQIKEIVRDSIIFRDRIQTQTVEVEKKLSWWQRLKMETGGITLLILLTAVILFLFTKTFNLKKL